MLAHDGVENSILFVGDYRYYQFAKHPEGRQSLRNAVAVAPPGAWSFRHRVPRVCSLRSLHPGLTSAPAVGATKMPRTVAVPAPTRPDTVQRPTIDPSCTRPTLAARNTASSPQNGFSPTLPKPVSRPWAASTVLHLLLARRAQKVKESSAVFDVLPEFVKETCDPHPPAG